MTACRYEMHSELKSHATYPCVCIECYNYFYCNLPTEDRTQAVPPSPAVSSFQQEQC